MPLLPIKIDPFSDKKLLKSQAPLKVFLLKKNFNHFSSLDLIKIDLPVKSQVD